MGSCGSKPGLKGKSQLTKYPPHHKYLSETTSRRIQRFIDDADAHDFSSPIARQSTHTETESIPSTLAGMIELRNQYDDISDNYANELDILEDVNHNASIWKTVDGSRNDVSFGTTMRALEELWRERNANIRAQQKLVLRKSMQSLESQSVKSSMQRLTKAKLKKLSSRKRNLLSLSAKASIISPCRIFLIASVLIGLMQQF